MTKKNKEAAAILRGLKDRIDRLERTVSKQGTPNLLRAVRDQVQAGDDVTVTVETGGSFVADSSAADGGDLCG